MFFTKSLRARTLLSVVIPTALGLVAVAIIALYAYEFVARDVVQQRDTELARISAERLAEGLSPYRRDLQSIAADEEVQSMDLTRVVLAMAGISDLLDFFDAGIAVYDVEGEALWGRPVTPRRRGTEFPLPSDFDEVRETLRPFFSDIFYDEISGEDVILIGVPVLDDDFRLRGVVAGMATLRYSLIGVTYAEVLEFQAGRSGYAYLVDGNGRVVYHRDSSRVGSSLADTVPVMRATSGETGAVLSEDATGETVISGFAPVPDTDWGLITQQSWESVVGPIRGYTNVLLGLLILGGLSSGALMFFAIGRVLRPIQDLTWGAERIAGGDFDYTIVAETDDEVQALAEQFNTMAGALRESYGELERRVTDRTKELSALNSIAEVVSRSLDLQEILNDALDLTLEVMGIEAGGIYLLRKDEEVLTVAAHKGVGARFVAEIDNLRVGEGFSGRVAQSGKPLVAEDLSSDPRLTRSVVTESGFRALAVVPLVASMGKVWGSLFVTTRDRRDFSEQDIELLTSIGDQIGVAIENVSLFNAEQRRAEQFRVIAEVGRHIISILDVDDLLEEIVRLVKETFGYYLVQIGLIEGDEMVFKVGVGPTFDAADFEPPRVTVGEDGVTAWVADTGQPLLVSDVSDDPRYVLLPGWGDIKSELAVPLRTKAGVIGVLDVESDQLNAFDDIDVTVLQSLANQAAIAIENARLYEDINRRLGQVIALQETTKALTSTLEPSRLLNLITEQATSLLEADGGVINLVDWDRNEDEVVAASGLAAFTPGGRSRLEGSLSGWAAINNEPTISNQLQSDSRTDQASLSRVWEDRGRRLRNAAVAPLSIKDQVIGTIVVLDKQGGEGAFDQSDLDLLVSFASQAAAAIENARLFDAEQRRAEQFGVISEVGRHITSILAVDDLLHEIVRLVKETFGYYLVGIGLIEGDEVVYKTGVGPPFEDPRFQPARLKVGREGITGWVAATGEPLLVPDVSQEPRYTLISDSAETRSELTVPLRTKSGVIGVLDVQSDQLDGFDESDLTVLQSLASQAAIAIENARLFDAEQRRAEQFRVISDVGAHITSILAVDELLAETVRMVKESFGYYLVGIGLIEGDELLFRTGAGPPFDDTQFKPPLIKVGGKGITAWVAATGEPLLVPDVSQEPRYLLIAESPESRSELAVPLKTKAGVIGVLDVQSDEANAFDETDLAVVQSLANLTAIAIEEARLFAAQQRRTDQLSAISEMGRHITSILAVDELLDEIVHLIRQTFGYYLVDIGLIEGDRLVFKAGAGPARGRVGEQLSVEVGKEGITGWVAGTGDAQLVGDLSKDPRYVCLYAPADSRSELCVPIKAKDAVIGVLNVESDRLDAFDESDVAVLESLANQAAVAIENARLYEQAQKAAALEERGRLARDLHDAVTQTLFSASLIGEVMPTLWESDQEEGRQLLQELRQLTRGALAEMRTLLLELRPAALAEAGLEELLRQLGESVTGRTGVAVKLEVEGECDLPTDVHVALYRIAQEALNNVVKHAQASEVAVRLHCSHLPDVIDGEGRQRVELTVSDDGRGFDPNDVAPNRLGLGIIRERAQAIGATVKIASQPGQGTQVELVWKG